MPTRRNEVIAISRIEGNKHNIRAHSNKQLRLVLAQDPAELFLGGEIIEANGARSSSATLILPPSAVVTSRGKAGKQAHEAPVSRARVCRGDAEQMLFIRAELEASTIIEVATLAHQLHSALLKTKPSQRRRK